MIVHNFWFSDDGKMLPDTMVYPDMPSVVLVPEIAPVSISDFSGVAHVVNTVYRKEQFAAPSPYNPRVVAADAIRQFRERL